jgi:hypothetical protein
MLKLKSWTSNSETKSFTIVEVPDTRVWMDDTRKDNRKRLRGAVWNWTSKQVDYLESHQVAEAHGQSAGEDQGTSTCRHCVYLRLFSDHCVCLVISFRTSTPISQLVCCPGRFSPLLEDRISVL